MFSVFCVTYLNFPNSTQLDIVIWIHFVYPFYLPVLLTNLSHDDTLTMANLDSTMHILKLICK